LTYDGTIGASYYDAYLENFMNPVYESAVDGVSVVKVWKNDEQHTKNDYKKQEEIPGVSWQKIPDGVLVDLKNIFSLSHLKLQYTNTQCNEELNGTVALSNDQTNWHILPEVLPTGAIPAAGEQPNGGNLYFPFLADKARFIKIKMASQTSCLSSVRFVSVYQLPDLK
jgi:hypothetical protein